MQRLPSLTLVCAGLLAACSSGSESRPGAEATAKETTNTRKELERYCEWAPRSAPTEPRLATARWPEAGSAPPPSEAGEPERTVDLLVTSGGLSVHPYDESPWGSEDLTRRLSVAMYAELEDPEEPRDEARVRWRLVAAADTPALRIVELLDYLMLLGYPRGSLLFMAQAVRADDAPPPPDRALADELIGEYQSQPPDQRSRWLAKQLSLIDATCPVLDESFRAVVSLEPEQQCRRIAAGAAKAYDQCSALMRDDQPLPNLLWIMLAGGSERARVLVDVTVDWSRPPRRFEASARWEELVHSTIIGLEPVELHLAGVQGHSVVDWLGDAGLAEQCASAPYGVGNGPQRTQVCMLACMETGEQAACDATIDARLPSSQILQRWRAWLCDERNSAYACHALAKMHPHGSAPARAALVKGIEVAKRRCDDLADPQRIGLCEEVYFFMLDGAYESIDDAQVRAAIDTACKAGSRGACQFARAGTTPREGRPWPDPTKE